MARKETQETQETQETILKEIGIYTNDIFESYGFGTQETIDLLNELNLKYNFVQGIFEFKKV